MPSDPALSLLIDAIRRGRLDAAACVAGLSPAALGRLERLITEALRPLPIPIGPRVSGAGVDRRRILEQLRAFARAQRGGGRDEVVATARVAWLRGGRHLDYLTELAASDRVVDAAFLGRSVLRWAAPEERPAIEEFLEGLSRPPDGWWQEVERFAEIPSPEGWQALVRFVPKGDVGYLRKIHTLDRLLASGVDGTRLFECVAEVRVTPETLRLIEEGEVDPLAVERHGDRNGHPDRSAWLGAAARAALVRNDRFSVIRFLRKASCATIDDLEFIWARADEELHAMMITAGVERRGGS